MEGHKRRPRHLKAPGERSNRSQAVVYSRVTGCDRLRFHSATAKQYCPSSSAVARRIHVGARNLTQGLHPGTLRALKIRPRAWNSVMAPNTPRPMPLASCSSSTMLWARKIITERSIGSACHQPPSAPGQPTVPTPPRPRTGEACCRFKHHGDSQAEASALRRRAGNPIIVAPGALVLAQPVAWSSAQASPV